MALELPLLYTTVKGDVPPVMATLNGLLLPLHRLAVPENIADEGPEITVMVPEALKAVPQPPVRVTV